LHNWECTLTLSSPALPTALPEIQFVDLQHSPVSPHRTHPRRFPSFPSLFLFVHPCRGKGLCTWSAPGSLGPLNFGQFSLFCDAIFMVRQIVPPPLSCLCSLPFPSLFLSSDVSFLPFFSVLQRGFFPAPMVESPLILSYFPSGPLFFSSWTSFHTSFLFFLEEGLWSVLIPGAPHAETPRIRRADFLLPLTLFFPLPLFFFFDLFLRICLAGNLHYRGFP